MAHNISSIETHPQRQKIINALLSGSSLRQIAAWAQPPVTTAAICRWRQKATATLESARQQAKLVIANNDKDLLDSNGEPKRDVMQAVTRAALTAAADPFIARVEQLRAERATVKAEAHGEGDYRAYAALDRNDLTELQLHAQLAGRLDTGAQQTNIMIVCPAGNAPEISQAVGDDAVTIDIAPAK